MSAPSDPPRAAGAPEPGSAGEPGRDRSLAEATRTLRAAAEGDSAAVEALFALVYDELRRLASAALRAERADHTLQPTALVHEAYLRLVDLSSVEWRGEARFFALAAQAMRRVLVDHARGKRRDKRGGGWQRVELDPDVAPTLHAGLDLVALDRALVELAQRSERQAKVVELRFFGGLDVETTARLLEVSTATVERDWRVARAWLSRTLEGALGDPDEGRSSRKSGGGGGGGEDAGA